MKLPVCCLGGWEVRRSDSRISILGAGVTGLAAGLASGMPVYEATEVPGGICSSYYVCPGNKERHHVAPQSGEAYRFEIGGGHWIFGGDPVALQFIRSITPVRSYERRSSVYLPDKGLFVPYPIQNHLRCLGPKLASKALSEMVQASSSNQPVATLAEWLGASFGPTLCELFFNPFHDLYTAGLWKSIAPQDAYKSPGNLSLAVQGAFDEPTPVGYNVNFLYPVEALSTLAQRLAARGNVHYGKRVVRIDIKKKEVYFADGSGVRYEKLLSTLPLNRIMEMAGLQVESRPDPYTSVLVINIGALKGPLCPQDHWIYLSRSKSGFHRVGFYSNVDASFLPASARAARDRVSIYAEKAYLGGQRPNDADIRILERGLVQELQHLGWIEKAEVIDPTWIDVAYTWRWAGSLWKQEALQMLQEHHIVQIGRYARWVFQGIADSIRDGLFAGAAIGG